MDRRSQGHVRHRVDGNLALAQEQPDPLLMAEYNGADFQSRAFDMTRILLAQSPRRML